MGPSLDWMERGNPHYDPNRIGAVSQAKVLAALTAAGKAVLVPCVNVRPYDFVIEDGGRFFRVQCKTGRLFRGAVCFRPHRLRAANRATGWVRRVTDYRGEVDFFGVYCPENESVYLVPIDAVTTPRVCTLRVAPAKNNQRKNVRWAADYRVFPPNASTQGGARNLRLNELLGP
jgi:hypothetical protein